jgi:uncharacterized OsmC-like protein
VGTTRLQPAVRLTPECRSGFEAFGRAADRLDHASCRAHALPHVQQVHDEERCRTFGAIVPERAIDKGDETVRREELQAVQAPLKNRYREDPAAAVVTLRAEADLDSTAVSCSVQTSRALVEAGLHPASGGDGTLACSGDMLLQALVACAGVTLRSVAVNRDITLTRGRICAAGELDFRGTMGVDREVAVGFRTIDLRFELDPALSDDDVQTLLTLTERYCVVYQTISKGVPVHITRSSLQPDPPATAEGR